MDAQLDPPVPAAALAHYHAGRRLHAARDLHGGLRELQAALQLAGEHPAILDALALLAADGGDLASAERILRRAQQLAPSIARAVRLGIALYQQKRYADALSFFEASVPLIQFNPDITDAFAMCLERTGQAARALALYEDILRRAPAPARAVRVVAALQRQGDYARMAQQLPALLARWPDNPDLVAAAAIHALGRGDFATGWHYMRQRVGHECDPRLVALPAWDGAPFAGTLVVTLEPHLGEEILMSSLFAGLVAMGQAALVEIDARLLPLFRRSWPQLQFVPRDGTSLQRALVPGATCRRATALQLAERFRPQATLPGTPAWLHADPAAVARIRAAYTARWPGKRLVGLSWRSARLQDDGRDGKSVPLAALVQTLSLADTVFIDLQYGDFRADVDALAGTGLAAPWRDPAVDTTQDIDALAAQLCALDAAVMVSNTTAHLAGALGVPTTVLLPRAHPVLWHWLFAGEQTPWYASVRLLRNPEDAGFALLDAQLAALLQGGAAPC